MEKTENKKAQKSPKKREPIEVKMNWSYVYFCPYIILMGLAYLVGVTLLCFRASYHRIVRLDDDYYDKFTEDEKWMRKNFTSIFTD
ncbi:unnamed protein product [marine sediment metagenome]|uniref:Uncharacterized protein n=1 Tax=marine sediment metagenome TaxID=412755 RepID=X0WYA8_9ZZZZ